MYLNHIKLLHFKSKQSNIGKLIWYNLNNTQPWSSHSISLQPLLQVGLYPPRPAWLQFPRYDKPPITMLLKALPCACNILHYLSWKLSPINLNSAEVSPPQKDLLRFFPFYCLLVTHTHSLSHSHKQMCTYTHIGTITWSQTFMVGPQWHSNYLLIYLPPALDYEHMKAETIILSAPCLA